MSGELTSFQGYIALTLSVEDKDMPLQGPLPIRKPKHVGVRLQMCLLLTGGVIAMLIHHFFYAFLNGRLADGGTFSTFRRVFHSTISDQSFVNAIANATATVGKMCLASVVGVAFIQVFWWRMRTTGYTLDQVDTVASFKENPADLTTWSAWYYTTLLSVVAICSLLMEVVTIATPGSLTVASTTVDQVCSIPVVDAANAASIRVFSEGPASNISYLYLDPSGLALELITRTLYTGSYIPPPSPCGVCEYNISFNAPALQCVDNTELIIANDTVPIGEEILVWNASVANWAGWFVPNSQPTSDVLALNVASRNLSSDTTGTDLNPLDNPAVAFVCTGYDATYHVNVQHNLTDTISVTGIDFMQPFTRDQQLESTNDPLPLLDLALWVAFGQQFEGTVAWNYFGGSLISDSGIIVNSPFTASPSSKILWQWQVDLVTAFPSLMQNISLSLVSGVLANTTNPNPPMQDSNCRVTDLHFVYDRVRLLTTYGATIGVAVVCLLVALVAIHRNKVGETMEFSRILGGVPVFRNSVEANGKIEDYLGKRIQVQRDGDEYEYEYEGGSRMTEGNFGSTVVPLMSEIE
ncbi:hypothetical protein PHLCEN_2v3423 [Hermanssonia centrifuga]|uniref:Uncharacterized protein n=1 Tax=Hermanssonia centrifuga TaxID=98765 RepID=A0A2R6QIU9_9APHY|nr:hypothetical protein PHLCEN_2v3423 [Hermanssonia centrifuga]